MYGLHRRRVKAEAVELIRAEVGGEGWRTGQHRTHRDGESAASRSLTARGSPGSGTVDRPPATRDAWPGPATSSATGSLPAFYCARSLHAFLLEDRIIAAPISTLWASRPTPEVRPGR